MTDNGLAALAAALEANPESKFTAGTKFDAHDFPYEFHYDRVAHAAAILDALDSAGWRLTARDKTSPNERTIATLRAALEGAVAELEKPTELHDYRGGFHRSPDCPGCMMLARLRAALATAKGTGGPTLPPPDLDLIENSDGNGNRWPEATP